MTADIEIAGLTSYSIADDGSTIQLCLKKKSGESMFLTFAIHDLGLLEMTLPNLIEAALRRQFQDTSLRYTHPMADWVIEQSTSPEQFIFTMRTEDGFGVSFSLPREKALQLGGALANVINSAPSIAFH